jgi:hypothetical protein
MSENVGSSTSCNPKGLDGLYRDNFTFYLYHDTSAGVAEGYGMDDQGIRVLLSAEAEEFSRLHGIHTCCGEGAHAAFRPADTGSPFPVVERHGLEADHSPPSSAEVTDTRTIPPHLYMSS